VGVDDGQLVRATDRLVDHVGHWAPARWTRPATGDPDGGSRADVVHGLAQRLADLEADVTGRAGRPVPRLGNDLALPDQVRVMVLDLVRAQAGPAVLAAALDAVTQARERL
jgi:hypothetical protein